MTKVLTRQAITAAFFQAFFVVFGVVLALAANEWRESKNAERHAEHALDGIMEELKSNRQAIQASLDYHNGLVEELRRFREESKAPTLRTFTRGFVSPANIFMTAWNAATETGALTAMDYQTVLDLSTIYAQQDRYTNQATGVGQAIYGEMLQGGTQALVDKHTNLTALIYTFVYREIQLIELYNKTLEELSNE